MYTGRRACKHSKERLRPRQLEGGLHGLEYQCKKR